MRGGGEGEGWAHLPLEVDCAAERGAISRERGELLMRRVLPLEVARVELDLCTCDIEWGG